MTGTEQSRAAGRVAPPPAPADVGLVAGLGIEVHPLLGRLEHSRKYIGERHTVVEGECAGKVLAVIVGGPGCKAAGRATRLLLAGHRPRWVISAGFAGALDPALVRNDLVLATELLGPDGLSYTLEVALADRAGPGPAGLRTGRLVTVDRIARTAAEKAELRGRTGADAVDMETSAVAAVCAERGVRFLSVRVISDEAGTDLPPEVLSVLGRTRSYRFGATLGALWRRPSNFKNLWALREHARAAADRLARVLPGLLARLP